MGRENSRFLSPALLCPPFPQSEASMARLTNPLSPDAYISHSREKPMNPTLYIQKAFLLIISVPVIWHKNVSRRDLSSFLIIAGLEVFSYSHLVLCISINILMFGDFWCTLLVSEEGSWYTGKCTRLGVWMNNF